MCVFSASVVFLCVKSDSVLGIASDCMNGCTRVVSGCTRVVSVCVRVCNARNAPRLSHVKSLSHVKRCRRGRVKIAFRTDGAHTTREMVTPSHSRGRHALSHTHTSRVREGGGARAPAQDLREKQRRELGGNEAQQAREEKVKGVEQHPARLCLLQNRVRVCARDKPSVMRTRLPRVVQGGHHRLDLQAGQRLVLGEGGVPGGRGGDVPPAATHAHLWRERDSHTISAWHGSHTHTHAVARPQKLRTHTRTRRGRPHTQRGQAGRLPQTQRTHAR